MQTLVVIRLVVCTLLVGAALALGAAAPGARASQCTGSSAGLADAECDVWVDFYDATGGNTTWKHCGGNRTDPCACSYEDQGQRGVTCSGSHITQM